MGADGFASAAKFVPMPTMSRVSVVSSGRSLSAVARLNAMIEPPSQIVERGANVVGPHRVRVLLGEPRFGRQTIIEQFDSLPLEDFQQELECCFVDESYSFYAYA
jgi:ureidoglycolate hydrolase